MPQANLGTVGFHLVWTAKLPPKAQKVLAQQLKQDGQVAAFGLTPSWGDVPTLKVADIRRAKQIVPDHWLDSNEVMPIISGMAFYIVPLFTKGMAASFSMKGVNLRTGLQEENFLTDNPCQSYWSGDAPPWIDGYVPGHGQAVQQFVPLRGDKEMKFDISDAAGVAKGHPWKDGISAAYYMPRDMTKLQPTSHYRHSDQFLGLESYSKSATRGGIVKAAREPEEVGMGAGALMRQKHPDNPLVSVNDFGTDPFLRLTARVVWDDQWNEWTRACGESPIPVSKLREFEEWQRAYEAQIWQRLGGPPKTTFVDQFPTMDE